MKEISAQEFEKEVLQAEGKVLVDFNAEWCGPCRMMKPILEVFAKENADTVKVVGINVDENGELAVRQRVSGIPCMILFENGEEIDRVVGVTPEKELKKMIER